MKKAVICICLVIVLVLISVSILFMQFSHIDYNNFNKISDVVSIEYADEDIKKIQTWIENERVNYFMLKDKANIQCVRKTYQGYYAVLLQESGSRAFVFMNKWLKIEEMLVFNGFKSRNDFDFLKKKNKITQDVVLNFDKNTILLPISSLNESIHIVQEGIIIVEYEFDCNLEESYVKNVRFIKNNEIIKNTDDVAVSMTPYILDIDKL